MPAEVDIDASECVEDRAAFGGIDDQPQLADAFWWRRLIHLGRGKVQIPFALEWRSRDSHDGERSRVRGDESAGVQLGPEDAGSCKRFPIPHAEIEPQRIRSRMR